MWLPEPCHCLTHVGYPTPHLSQAVQAWHAAGYLHGDIKPDNIALDRDGRHGRVRLLDVSHSVSITGECQHGVTGTRGFAASDEVASLSSELYSVGATLNHEVRCSPCQSHQFCCCCCCCSCEEHSTAAFEHRAPFLTLRCCARDVHVHYHNQMSDLLTTDTVSIEAISMHFTPEWGALQRLVDKLMAGNAGDRPSVEEAIETVKRLHEALDDRVRF